MAGYHGDDVAAEACHQCVRVMVVRDDAVGRASDDEDDDEVDDDDSSD